MKWDWLFLCLFTLGGISTAFAADESAGDPSRITDKVIPLAIDSIPRRPAPILELGDPFFNSGELSNGFTLPTGAVWSPSLIVWGTFRSAFQTIDDSRERVTEWSNRFDAFANLYLTPTERILVGMRPLDKAGRFTRYTFQAPSNAPEEEDSYNEELNSNITTLFFEGDFSELFPVLDTKDSRGLDIGIAVGRQPLSFQDGMLLNDSVDSLGLSKINLKPEWAANYRVSLLWGWDELNRSNLADDDSASTLYGMFNEIDLQSTTLEFDAAYVEGSEATGDGFFAGVGASQRIAEYNTAFRALGSLPSGSETVHNSGGALLFAEISRTLHASDNFLYLTGFWGIDEFRSASRSSTVGGPLEAVGVLFTSVGLGRYGSALESDADDAFGGALGFQMFFNERRTQLLIESGGRYAREERDQRAIATGFSLQQAIGRRIVVRIDGFGSYGRPEQGTALAPFESEEFGYGARFEWQLQL